MAFGRQNIVEILIRARDEASKKLSDVTGKLEQMETQAVIVGASMQAIGTAAVAGLSAATIRGARFAEEITSLSDRLQVNTDTVTALGVAYVRAGGQIADQEVALRTLQRSIVEAASGNRQAASTFELLGIKASDLVAEGGGLKSVEDLLPQIADGLSRVENRSVRVDAAMTLFGRSGNQIIPVLERGRAGLREYSAEAEKLGIALGSRRTREIAELSGNLNILKLSSEGAALSVAGALAPSFSDAARNLTSLISAVGAFVRGHPAAVQATTALASGMAAVGFGAVTVVGVLPRLKEFSTILAALGLSVGALTGIAAAAGLLAVVIAGLAEEGRKMRVEQERDAAAQKDFETAMQSGTASVREQIAALERLRTARGNIARREAPEATPPVPLQGEARIAFQSAARERARQDALAKFDAEYADIRRTLEGRAAAESLGIEIPAEITVEPDAQQSAAEIAAMLGRVRDTYQRLLDGATGPRSEFAIRLPAPTLEFAPLDDNTLESQIKRQQEIVARDLAKRDQASASLKVAQEAGVPSGITDAEERLQQAVDSHAQSSIRLGILTDQLAEKRRNLTVLTRDNADATLALTLAQQAELEKTAEVQRAQVEAAAAELASARARANETTGGVQAQEDALRDVSNALARYREALTNLEGTERAITDQRRRHIEATNDLEAAYRAVEQATQRAAVADAAGSDEARTAALQALEVEQRRQDLIRAREALSVGPLQDGQRIAALRELADAQDAYTQAIYRTGDAEVDAASKAGARLGHALLGDATNALTSFGQSWEDTFARLAQDAIRQILQVTAQLLAARAIANELTSSIGIIPGVNPLGPFAFLNPLNFLGFASGGKVPLSLGRPGVDSVPALLTPGERVIPDGLNQKLERLADNGARGNITVNYNAAISLASGPETRRAQRRIKRMLDDYQRENVAISALDR